MAININKEKFSDAYIEQDLGKSGKAFVDLFNGNLTFVHTDVQFNYGNPIISVGHVYSAKSQTNGAYGNNWSLNCDEKIITIEDGKGFKYYDPSGNVEYFYRAKTDVRDSSAYQYNILGVYDIYISIQSSNIVVECNAYKNGDLCGGRYIMIDTKGNKKYFTVFRSIEKRNSEACYIESIEFADGNTITYIRDEDNPSKITQIKDNKGRYVNFTYLNGLLKYIEDSAGRKKKYVYTDNNLTTINYLFSDSTNVQLVRFEYNSNNQITRIIGKNGVSYLYEYPANSARVSKVTKQSKYKIIRRYPIEEEDYTSYESWDISYDLEGWGVSENKEYDSISTYDKYISSRVETNLGVKYYYGFKTDNGFYYYNALSYEEDKCKTGVAKDTMSVRTSQNEKGIIVSTAKDNLLKNPNFDSTVNNPEIGHYPKDWQGFCEGENENYVTNDALDSTRALIIPADGREHCVYQSVNNEIKTNGLGEEYNSLNGGIYTLSAWIKGGQQALIKEFSLMVKYYDCEAETVSLTDYELLSTFGDDKWTYVIKSVYLPNTKQDSGGKENGIESIKVCINFKSTYMGNNNNLLVDRMTLNRANSNIIKSEPVLVCKNTNGEVIYKFADIDYENSTVKGSTKPTTFTAQWIQLQLLNCTMSWNTNTTDVSQTRLKFKDGNECLLKNMKVLYNGINCYEDSNISARIEKDTKGNPVMQKLWNRGKTQTDSFDVTKTFDDKHRELTNLDYRSIQTANTYTAKTDTNGEIITQTIKKLNQTKDIYVTSVEKTLDGCAIKKQTDASGKTVTYDYTGNDDQELEKDVLYKETYPDGLTVSYTYDRNGNVATMTLSKDGESHTFAYTYNFDYLTSVVVDNKEIFTYDYDGIGNIKCIKKNGVELASYNYVYRYDLGLPPYKTTTKFGETYVTEFDVYGNPTSIYEAGSINLISTMEYDSNTKECKKINDFTNTDSNGIPTTVWTTTSDNNKTAITAAGSVNFENTIYQKDGLVSEEELKIGNDTFNTKFEFEIDSQKGRFPDNRLTAITIKDGENKLMAKTSYTYDNLGRVAKKYLKNIWDESTGEEKNVIYQHHIYNRYGNNTYICDNIRNFNTTLYIKDKTKSLQMMKTYIYDDRNNITNIKYQNLFFKSMIDDSVDESVTTQTSKLENVYYVYDEHGKLIRENNSIAQKTYLYEYDSKGNLTSKYEIAYTTGEPVYTDEDVPYSYDYNSNGYLTAVNNNLTGEDVVVIGQYDSFGNPHKYNGKTLTWNGQRLMGYGNNTYTYDMRGLRLSKTVNNVTTNYVYDSESRLVQETKGSQRINYLYNMSDLIGFTIPYVENGVTKQFAFYYIKDAQGNICYIVDNKGNLVVSYNYDAWGNIVSKYFFKYGPANTKTSYSAIIGTSTFTAQDIDELNSHYYRGYYLDKETGFYYLTTRFYDPKTGRFISADDPKYLDYTMAYGHNRYAYCVNNPVMYVDPSGASIIVALIVGAVVGIAVGVGYAAYNDYKDDGEVNGSIGWYNYVGAGIVGGIIGAGIGAGLGAIAGTSFTLTIPMGSMLAGGGTAVATTVTITVSGEVVAGAVGLGLSALGRYMFDKTWKSGGYRIKHYSNDHEPKHLHMFGDDMRETRIDLEGKPLKGEDLLNPKAKRSLKKIIKKILECLGE